jgi:hypothetical protein
MMTTPSALTAPRRGRVLWAVVALGLVIATAIAALNYFLVSRVVSAKLTADPRNSGYALSAHYGMYLEPGVLVLDLRSLDKAAPLDLFRGLFQASDALYAAGRRFDRVVLARQGTDIFLMKGDDFAAIGQQFGAGQNPVYLIRTLPEKLYKPTGEGAFGQWTGGLLGVLGKQMEDANAAAKRWGEGR